MNNFKVCLTHDVDRVKKSYQYISHDLIKLNISNMKSIFIKENPYWCFDKIMKIEDKYNVRSTFFFLQESLPFRFYSPKNWEISLGKYKFSYPNVSNIIKSLDYNGWEIELHGSYNSYIDFELLSREKEILEMVLAKPIIGIRQHYLNLDIPYTWKLQKEAGFLYDSSFGLKNNVGFPKGKYFPFVDDESGMFIIPLTLMDGYLFQISDSIEDAWKICLKIIDEAEKNNAVLTVLWHQRVFNEKEFPGYMYIYEKILQECKTRGAKFKLCMDLINEKAQV